MNDFAELELELKRLRPARPSPDFSARIESALTGLGDKPQNIIVPSRFRFGWIGLGLGVAAALLFLARVDQRQRPQPSIVSQTPRSIITPRMAPNYQPAGLTQVVYEQRDEGLVYPAGWSEPVRRVRTSKMETLRWSDDQTGSSIRVSYPAEEVTFTPVPGQ